MVWQETASKCGNCRYRKGKWLCASEDQLIQTCVFDDVPIFRGPHSPIQMMCNLLLIGANLRRARTTAIQECSGSSGSDNGLIEMMGAIRMMVVRPCDEAMRPNSPPKVSRRARAQAKAVEVVPSSAGDSKVNHPRRHCQLGFDGVVSVCRWSVALELVRLL